MKKPQSLRSILEKTLKNLEIDVPLKTYSILGAWNEIVGESVAVHSQPRSIRNRILFIDVSPAMAPDRDRPEPFQSRQVFVSRPAQGRDLGWICSVDTS